MWICITQRVGYESGCDTYREVPFKAKGCSKYLAVCQLKFYLNFNLLQYSHFVLPHFLSMQ